MRSFIASRKRTGAVGYIAWDILAIHVMAELGKKIRTIL